jgi:transposase
VAVFGLLKRVGKVFTAILPNAKTETLLPIIEEKVTPDSIVYTDSFKAYNALDVHDFHHMRINLFRTLRRPRKSHKWNRGFLESGEASFKEIQRH